MKSVLRRTLAGALLLAAFSAIFLLSLPSVLERWVIPVLLTRISVENASVEVTSLTPFSATGTLSIEPGGEPLLAVPRFKILFSPSSLVKKRVSMLILDHAVVHLTRQDGDIGFSATSDTASSGAGDKGFRLPALPFMLDALVLKQCSLVLHEMQQPDLRITASGRINPVLHPRDGGIYEFGGLDGNLIFSDSLSAAGRLQIEVGNPEVTVALQVENGHLQLDRRFIPETLDIGHIGPFKASSKLVLDTRTRAIRHLELQAQLDRLDLGNSRLALSGGDPGLPLSVSLSGPLSNLSYEVGPLAMHAPLHLVTELKGTIVADKPVLYTAGVLDAIITPRPEVDDTQVILSLSHSLTYIPGGEWLLKLKGSSQGDGIFPVTNKELVLAIPDLSIDGEAHGTGFNGNGRLQLQGDSARITRSGTPFDLEILELRALVYRQDERSQVRLSGTIDRVSSTPLDLAMNAIRFDLPLQLPLGKDARSGTGALSIDTLNYRDVDLAALNSSIKQRGETFHLDGTISALFDPALQISFDSSLSPRNRQAFASWRLEPRSLDGANLPLLPPQMDTVEFGGMLEASGEMRLNDRGFLGNLMTTLQDGYFRIPAKNLGVESIECTVEFADLPALVSRPSQRCTFGTADMGTFSFSDGLADFRIEDDRTIFIEKSKVRWAQGSLESGSLRLSADTRELDTTLFASRINFSDLLNQFGFEQTEGQGSLNGKLPIKLSSQGLDFDDGFLFSTPGTGGIVRFTNTDMLSQAMGGTIEAGYLNYSLMALEDFAYNWTRLSFNSSGEDLLMTMELDGKPRTPLPFGFKDGMIIATDQGEGLQYPIRLDVNFNMPLNELLKVGTHLKSIMEN